MTSLAYIWGEDAWGIDRAARDLAREWAGDDGMPLDTWRASADDDTGDAESGNAAKRRTRLLDEIAMRLASSTMFGGGTLVVVRQPGTLLRETVARERTDCPAEHGRARQRAVLRGPRGPGFQGTRGVGRRCGMRSRPRVASCGSCRP